MKTAQTLLRHSTPVLTIGCYTHTLRGSEQSAVDRLPGFDAPPDAERQKATGTDGKAAESAPISLTNQLTKKSDFSGHLVSFSGNLERSKTETGKTKKPAILSKKQGFSGSKITGGGGIRTHEITVLQTVALDHLATPPNVLFNNNFESFIK